MPEGSDAIGQQIGPYRILRVIGRGGTSIVYEAVHTVIGQRVAIKRLLIHLHTDARKRALREARALGAVEHEGLVRVIDCLEMADGTPCLILELLDGQVLRSRLGTPLPVTTVLSLGAQIASALATAHCHGIVHRDLKPENIMLRSTGNDEERIKLLDFGLAKFLDVSETAMHSVDGLRCAGTPAYVAPEQCVSDATITARCDVYSLGVVLYEMLCGRLPFVAEPSRLPILHAYQAPRPLRAYRPDLPPALERLVLRMLAKPPTRRPAMEEVAAALQKPMPPSQPGKRLALHIGMALSLLLLTVCATFLGYVRWHRATATMAWIPGGRFLQGSSDTELAQTCDWLHARPRPQPCLMPLLLREQPQHQVELSPFLMDVHEVTNQQLVEWLNRLHTSNKLCVQHWPSSARLRVYYAPDCQEQQRPIQGILLLDTAEDYVYAGILYDAVTRQFRSARGREQAPAVMVTWDGARLYCQQQGKDLPTESEWEYTARGGAEQQRFPWGQVDPGCASAVFGRHGKPSPSSDVGECADYGSAPAAVGTTRTDCSRFGVRDLAGNAAEWVRDEYVERYPPCPIGVCLDPLLNAPAAANSVSHSVRGGSWRRPVDALRPTSRSRWPKTSGESRSLEEQDSRTMSDLGFRCMRSLRDTPQYLLKLHGILFRKQCQ